MAEGKRRGRAGEGRLGGYINGQARQDKRRGGLGCLGGGKRWRIKQRQEGTNPAAAAAAAATAGVVLASPSSQRHRVTESQTWWHCPAGEVARHRNTRPCQSSAGGAGELGELGSPAWSGQSRAQVGAHRLSAHRLIHHSHHLFLSWRGEGGGASKGGGNWELEINVAQVAGWHLRRRTVAVGTWCLRSSRLACIPTP